MWADRIMGLLQGLVLWSPGILLLVLVIAWTTRSESGRKPSVLVSFGSAALLGCVGAFGIEVVQPGGWNLQFLVLPFLWCKWAVIGFCPCWFLMGFASGNLRSLNVVPWFFGAVAFVLLSLTIASHTYVPAVYSADQAFWRKVFLKRIANLSLGEYQTHLSSEGQAAVAHQLQYNKQTAPELLPILAKLLPRGLAQIADQTTITRPLIEQMLQEASVAQNRDVTGFSPSTEGLPQLARNPATPTDVLEILACYPSDDVRANVALNKGAPPSVLEKLVNDESRSYVVGISVGVLARATLAEHPQTTGDRLMDLGHDSSAKVREAAARNLNAPFALLAELSKDSDSEVRRDAWVTMGRSPQTPVSKLGALAEHSDHAVWAAVASNPNTPLPLVAKLLHRGEYETRMAAICNLATGDESARDLLRQSIRNFDTFDTRALADHKGLPKWVYLELLHPGQNIGRKNACERLSNLEDVTEQELRDVIEQTDKSTLAELAASKRCSPILLRILAEGPLAEIQTMAQKTLKDVEEHGVYDK